MGKATFYGFLFLIFSLGVEAATSAEGGFGFEETNAEFTDNFHQALQSANVFSGTTDGAVTVNLPEGGAVTVDGAVEISEGLISADRLEFEDGRFTGVQGFDATADGYTADQVERLEQGGFVLTNARGVQYQGDTLRADHAEGFRQGDTLVTDAVELNAEPRRFHVAGAGLLTTGDVTITGLPEAEVAVAPGSLRIDPDDVSTFPIRLAGGDTAVFAGSGSVEVSVGPPQQYEVTEGRIAFNSTTFSEAVETNATAIVVAGESGIQRVSLGRGSSYAYYDQHAVKDFILVVPDSEEAGQTLCFLPSTTGVSEGTCDSIVDVPNRTLMLSGLVEYRRYPVKDGQLADLVTKPVYAGRNSATEAVLRLDDQFFRVLDILVTRPSPSRDGVVSWTNMGWYAVYEYAQDGDVTRFGRFNSNEMPDLVQQYRSFFGTEKPVIRLAGQALIQNGTSPVAAICRECEDGERTREAWTEDRASFANSERWWCARE